MASDKKWALITGAAGGIGQALVREFISAGYKVIAADIRSGQHGYLSSDVYSLSLDLADLVTNNATLDTLLADVTAITEGRGISALINNAAVQILSATEEISVEQWNATWAVNLHAPFFLIQSFLSQLAQNDGAVVNISSIHARQTKRKFVAYATSKAALSSLTRNLAVDIGNLIRINAIEPAAVGTDMLLAGFNESPEKLSELNSYHPIGRIATPREVAELALFLCSEKSQFIQGECISVSGGIDACLSDPELR